MNPDRTIQILLVEDNPGDIYLMTSELKNMSLPTKLHVVVDGEEAINFLQKKGTYENVQRPDMIILDLNLPRIDGREVLACIKADSTLANIPLIIVSASDEDKDILNEYHPHLNVFIKKPDSLTSFQLLIEQIKKFMQKNLASSTKG
ncbi:MAG: response regulator [Candidatus Magnetomorum sp.]|nr:response regulator [Candidatus Magnetomorum sp.]